MIYTVMLTSPLGFAPTSRLPASRFLARQESQVQMLDSAVVIGVAADSGCGKSTFMRRLTSIFGGESKCLPIGRETNTLISDMTTVICLDDYHKWDRTGRKSNPEWPDGITALHEACQDWDKMAADVTDLKAGKTVSKPIYNHITGELDPVEEVPATPIVIFEGLHPLYDDRVRDALDLTIYLDITDEVKFAWKAQRDIAERGATMEDVQAAIDARKPDFSAYVEPQKQKADIVIQARPPAARRRWSRTPPPPSPPSPPPPHPLSSRLRPSPPRQAGADVGRGAGRLGQVPEGQVHPAQGQQDDGARLPDGRGLGGLVDAQRRQARERGRRQARQLRRGLVRLARVGRRDGRRRRQARGDHLPRVAAVQHRHQGAPPSSTSPPPDAAACPRTVHACVPRANPRSRAPPRRPAPRARSTTAS